MIKSKKSNTYIWVAGFLLLTTFFFIVYNFESEGFIRIIPHSFGIEFDLICIGITISIIAILIYYFLRKGKIDIFEFPIWFTLNIYIQVILNVWLVQRNIRFTSPWLQSNPDVNAIQTMMLLWVGMIFIWVAWLWPKRLTIPLLKIKNSDKSNPRIGVITAFWFFTWMINLYFIINGSQGYLGANSSFIGGNYLLFISLINDLTTFILMIYIFTNPSKVGYLWMIFAISSRLLLSIFMGTKGGIFILLYLIMSYYYVHRKLKKTWVLLGIVAILITVPLVTTFRENLFKAGFDRNKGASYTARFPVLIDSFTSIFAGSISDIIYQTQDNLKERQGGIFEVTAAFMAVHPKYQPFVIHDFINSFTHLIIPRFIWPDKPTARPDLYNISTNYLGSKIELSFSESGQIADAYRVGGIIFLFIWLVFISRLILIMYKAGPEKSSMSGTSLYLLFITGFITYNLDLLSTILKVNSIWNPHISTK